MLMFRNIKPLFGILLVILITLDSIYAVPVYLYFILSFVFCSLVFYGCYYIGSGFFIPVICKAETAEHVIAISFDDGPALYTSEILGILKQHNIQACFFCIGNRIAGKEDLLKDIVSQDHIIGNHSFSHHFFFDLYSGKRMLEDMRLMDKTMEEVTGLKPRLFRPPYGVTNPNLARAVVSGNYIPVGWDVRTMDTVATDQKRFSDALNRALKPGSVFLFHDTSKITKDVLPAFLTYVRQQGYRIERLDKMLNLQAYA